MPSTVTLRILAIEEVAPEFAGAGFGTYAGTAPPGGTFRAVHYELLNEQGETAIRGGLVVFGPPLQVPVGPVAVPNSAPKSKL
jgi:hypothetical protein